MSIIENKKIKCRDGETFTVAGMKFIKFPGKGGQTPAVMKDNAFRSRFGEENNDLQGSIILKRIQEEVLPKITEALGEENVCAFKTDLTTLDGLKPYPETESKISLVTLDFYRANAENFGRYKPDCWWWLATPESAQPNDDPDYAVCVSPSGCISGDRYYNSDFGVRPFLIFKSDIFESFEA